MQFNEWYEAQFGKRPSKETLGDLHTKWQATQADANHLKEILRRVGEWERRRTACLYAWSIADKDKK